MERLREKISFYLFFGETNFEDSFFYPFDNNFIPILAMSVDDEERYAGTAYESGNRSIVLKQKNGWFKAKGIGIPTGLLRPFLWKECIYSYHLYDEIKMGDGDVLWGFLKPCEAFNEFENQKFAATIGLPSPLPIGTGTFSNFFTIKVKDRSNLIRLLKKKTQKAILQTFIEKSEETISCCVFSRIFSDIRVDEILYAFIFSGIEKLFNDVDCKDYIKWLGSSCGWNLRMFHDQDLLHGTIKLRNGFNTNSYLGNHTISEEKTSILDFDLTSKVKNEADKMIEFKCLNEVMNPLNPYSYLTKDLIVFIKIIIFFRL